MLEHVQIRVLTIQVQKAHGVWLENKRLQDGIERIFLESSYGVVLEMNDRMK
jgi:hypothetical protein